MAGKVRVFESEEDLSIALADYVAQLSEASVKERGAFAIALSGGPLIRLLGKLTKAPYLKTVDWSKWHVFWAEEKVIPSRKLESNYKQAKQELLSKVPILPGHINSVSQTGPAESAAEEYEFAIRQLVRNRTVDVARSSDCPRFDLVLLVLEQDGRVSSLYPNRPVLAEETQWVYPVSLSSQGPPDSVTLSLPVINSAANAAVIAIGRAVGPKFASAVGRGIPTAANPAQLISLRGGDLVWFADEAAAGAASTPDSSFPAGLVD